MATSGSPQGSAKAKTPEKSSKVRFNNSAILKKTANTAAFIGQMEGATIVNEVGASSAVSSDSVHPQLHKQKQYIGDKERERKWIRQNVYMKICRSFKENSRDKEFCMCGRKKTKEHTPDALANPCPDKWSLASEACIDTRNTTAYGEIEFPNANIAKFVRVADDTDMDDMMHLLTDFWGLTKPNLLISVTGGAKNIVMSKKLKDAFKKGLLKTAQTTGAWILTGGNNHGVMKYVGEAVNMLQSSRKVVAFGIAPWGCVMNKRELTAPEGVWPAYYQLREEVSKNANLDPNHTHFLLVDNGTFRKFGTEIEFRGLLEKFISNMKTDADEASATNVPVVSIVVEGGPGTLTTVKAAIDNATPVVILNGSGRAADMLAYAYNNTEEEEVTTYDSTGKAVLEKVPRIPDEIKAKLRDKVIAEWPKKDTDELVEMIIHCVMRRHLIVIFSLDDKHSLADIDIAILHAIMKANKNDAMNQLKLALAWNRIDIVREEIFTEEKNWDAKGLEDILQTALIQNKSDFVDLLMDHIHMGNFVTKKRMLELYNSVQPTNLLYRVLKVQKNKPTSLNEVGEAIQSLIGDFYSALYIRDPRYNSLDTVAILGKVKKRSKTRHGGKRPRLMRSNTFFRGGEDSSESEEETAVTAASYGTAIGVKSVDLAKNKVQPSTEIGSRKPKRVYDFEWPARELFLWCVLMRRKKLAMLFLQEEKYAIAPSLTASIMLRGMRSQSYTVDSEVISEIEDLASEFESMAIGVLGECFTADEPKSKTLLIRAIPSYGDTTLLQLAVEAGNKEFVGHQACQNLLTNIWWGKMDQLQKHAELRVTAACLLPFLWPFIPWFIEFLDGQELKEQRPKPRKSRRKRAQQSVTLPRETLDEQAMERYTNSMMDQEKGKEDEEDRDMEKPIEELSTFGKYIAFFNAPKVTFLTHTIFYLAFLLLFAYMMLCDFKPEIRRQSWIEITIAVWVGTLFIEELRQFYVAETNSFMLKIVTYFSDVWNLVDIGTVILFVIGYGLRVVDHTAIVTQRTLKKIDELQQEDIDELDEWLYFREDDTVIVANRLSYSRVILCLALMVFVFRILHIFSVIRILGPKLVMIGRMIKDLVAFFIILVVFIFAFGIAQHAIMFPNEPFTAVMIYRTLRLAYWQMYGELFLDDLEGENMDNCVERCTDDKFCFGVRDYLYDFRMNRTCADGSAPTDRIGTCRDNSTIGCWGGVPVPAGLPKTAFPDTGFVFCYTNSSGIDIPLCEDDLDRCPEVNRIVPVMLGIYILFTQILMFNLLIAMFSYTFTIIQENTDIHWKFQQYSMIKEYYTRPPTPPPFIFLNHIVLFIRWIYRKCKNIQNIRDAFKIWLDEATEKQMASWERINYEEYNRKEDIKEEMSMESKVTRSKGDLDHLMNSAEGMSNLPNLYDRINHMECRMVETGEALNWIMDALSTNKMGKGRPPMMKLKDDETSRQEVLDAEEKLFKEWSEKKKKSLIHIKCRASPYPKAPRIRRFPVPNTKVYWEIPWKGYLPIKYTSDEILHGADYADPDLSSMPVPERQSKLTFNAQDGDVCRISGHGQYEIDKDGFPLNPFGRTGLIGRGVLGRWGPNHALDAMVSRWKRYPDGDFELKNGKKILEFIGVKREDNDEWALPGINYDNQASPVWRRLMNSQTEENTEEVAIEAIKEKAFGDCMTIEEKQKLDSISNPKIVYQGYVDDPRNTDNAWIETLAYNFHDETSQVTEDFKLNPGEKVSKVAWIEASPDLILYAGHTMIIRKLIDMFDAAE